MGNPNVLYRENLSSLWKCKDCGNIEEFEEDWLVEIIQYAKNKDQEINLIESENIRCKKCGSHAVEGVEIIETKKCNA